MKSNTKKLTEGAMIVALIGAILFIDRQFAYMFTSQFNWLLSIPMIIYSIQSDRKYSFMVFFSTMIIGFFITNIQTLFYLFSALLLGTIYGEGVRNKWKQEKLLIWTIVCTFICYLISMYILAGFFGYDLVATRNEFIQMIENFEIAGIETVLYIDAHTLFNVIDITSFFLLVIAESLCVHFLSHLIFIKLKLDIERIQFSLTFKYPKILSIGGIVALLFMYVLKWFEFGETIEFILAFFYLTMFIINLVYGMIIIRCMRQLPKWFRLILIVLPFCWTFIMILGIVDGLMDGELRKRGLYGQVRKL